MKILYENIDCSRCISENVCKYNDIVQNINTEMIQATITDPMNWVPLPVTLKFSCDHYKINLNLRQSLNRMFDD
jgi:hypothetical protein